MQRKKKKTLSLDNGRKKKTESFIHKQQTSTPILILGTCFLVLFQCILHIKGMPIPFRFHQVLLISILFFIALLSMRSNFILISTTAIENSGTFSDSTFVSYELISTNNSPLPNNKIFFYGCYIQVALVEYLTTWVPIEHKRDKPIIRMQIFYVLSKRT